MSWIIFILAVALYLLPTGIATNCRHRNLTPIMLVNLLLGWTVIGWLVALIWSTTNNVEGRSAPALVKCRACAEMILPDAKICKHCHTPVSAPPSGMRVCPECHRPAPAHEKFCPVCGANMTIRA